MTQTVAALRVRRVAVFAAVAWGALVVDAGSKAAMLHGGGPVELPFGAALRLAHNTGAAFSIGTGLTPLFTVVAAVVVAGLCWYAPKLAHAGWMTALGLIAGGAAGNLWDRLFRAPGFARGAVVDWIDVGAWPVFNLADTFLCCGVALAMWMTWRNIPITAKSDAAQAKASPRVQS